MLLRPNVCYIFEEQGVKEFQILYGHGQVELGREGNGRGGHKDKYKDKDTDKDKYKVLQRPNYIC